MTYRRRTAFDHSDRRISILAQSFEGGAGADTTPGQNHADPKVLHGELIGVVIILLCAAAMARGGFV